MVEEREGPRSKGVHDTDEDILVWPEPEREDHGLGVVTVDTGDGGFGFCSKRSKHGEVLSFRVARFNKMGKDNSGWLGLDI